MRPKTLTIMSRDNIFIDVLLYQNIQLFFAYTRNLI